MVNLNYHPDPFPFLAKCESVRKLIFLLHVDYKYRLCPRQHPIAKKCQSVRKLLLPLASTLNGAKLEFYCQIDQNDLSDFSDHQMLLDHIGNDLLPICNAFRAYEFHLKFLSEKSAPTVISSILGMGPARNCPNVKFVIFGIDLPTALPVKAISNWFFHCVVEDKKRKNRKKKSLEIKMNKISNGTEIQTHLKEANCGFYLVVVQLGFNTGFGSKTESENRY